LLLIFHAFNWQKAIDGIRALGLNLIHLPFRNVTGNSPGNHPGTLLKTVHDCVLEAHFLFEYLYKNKLIEISFC
jgi:hypothetical protein